MEPPGTPVCSCSMSLELGRKVWTGEIDLKPSVYDGSLTTGKGGIFQGHRRGPCPSAESWRSHTFKGQMGYQNKSMEELVKMLTMKTKGEFQTEGWSAVSAVKR